MAFNKRQTDGELVVVLVIGYSTRFCHSVPPRLVFLIFQMDVTRPPR